MPLLYQEKSCGSFSLREKLAYPSWHFKVLKCQMSLNPSSRLVCSFVGLIGTKILCSVWYWSFVNLFQLPYRVYRILKFKRYDLLVLQVNHFTRWKGVCPREQAMKLSSNNKLRKNILIENSLISNIIKHILPGLLGRFPPDVALTTCMSCWKFFSRVVSRDFMDFSMMRQTWFTITGLWLFFVGASVAFELFQTLLSSAVAGTITVTHDSQIINHMIRDQWIY